VAATKAIKQYHKWRLPPWLKTHMGDACCQGRDWK